MAFSTDFVWGVASASYQIEGAIAKDGRSPSVWDVFAETPGKVFDGHTGEMACDSYSRLDEDIDLIAGLGARGYRFSIAWPRVMPNGTGEVNPEGLAYYDRLVDGLLERGIDPWVTLYHWDMPVTLAEKGGWQSRESIDWFTEYTSAVVKHLSDRVTHWITLNEPQIFLGLGHQKGTHAPGLQLDRPELLQTVHHALLAHGASVQAIRAGARKTPRIGAAPAAALKVPHTDSDADIEAARQATFSVPEEWPFCYTWFCDPMILGGYPEDGVRRFASDMPEIRSGDMERIKQPLDFFGVNIYTADIVRAGPSGPEPVDREPGYPITMFRWPVQPEALYWGPRFLAERYGLPVVVTENGLASMDWIHCDGKVHDAARIDFLTRYLRALKQASDEGVDVRGYFQWSILDNFEWAEGYALRFGLVYMDYRNMKRLPKDSYYWFRAVIESNGRNLPDQVAPLSP